jgi:hypothetical protein
VGYSLSPVPGFRRYGRNGRDGRDDEKFLLVGEGGRCNTMAVLSCGSNGNTGIAAMRERQTMYLTQESSVGKLG